VRGVRVLDSDAVRFSPESHRETRHSKRPAPHTIKRSSPCVDERHIFCTVTHGPKLGQEGRGDPAILPTFATGAEDPCSDGRLSK
jgi:hypothetical protein